MSFLPRQFVKVLAEPLFDDDPPVGTVATVEASDSNGGGTTVSFSGGSATYFDDELEPAW